MLVKEIAKYITVAVFSVAIAFSAATHYFGLRMVSSTELASLHAANTTLQKLKAHNARAKAALAKKTTAKAGRRLSTNIVAASTFGAVLVATTSAAFLIQDHCEETESLVQIDAIVEDKEVEFDMKSCVLTLEDDLEDWITEAVRQTPQVIKDQRNKLTQELGEGLNRIKQIVERSGSTTWSKIRRQWEHAW
jgi:glutaredoxin